MLALASLIFTRTQMQALLKMEGGEPLERNSKRSQGHGKTKPIHVTMFVAEVTPGPDAIPIDVLNCLSFLAMGIGNATLFPKHGPREGVEVVVTGGKGFADRLIEKGSTVLFKDMNEIKQVTNEEGLITFSVMGRQVERDYALDKKPIEDQFTVNISSTLTSIEVAHIALTFLNSAVCAANPGIACAEALADILKTFHWDFGWFAFGLRDWDRLPVSCHSKSGALCGEGRYQSIAECAAACPCYPKYCMMN